MEASPSAKVGLKLTFRNCHSEPDYFDRKTGLLFDGESVLAKKGPGVGGPGPFLSSGSSGC